MISYEDRRKCRSAGGGRISAGAAGLAGPGGSAVHVGQRDT